MGMVIGYRIAFAIALLVFLGLRLDVYLTRRKIRRLITDPQSRRWYPLMQQVAESSRLKSAPEHRTIQ